MRLEDQVGLDLKVQGVSLDHLVPLVPKERLDREVNLVREEREDLLDPLEHRERLDYRVNLERGGHLVLLELQVQGHISYEHLLV